MSRALLCITLLLSSYLLSAQETTVSTAETPKTKNIRKLLTLTGSGKLGIQVMETMITSFKSHYPNVDSSFWKDFMKEVRPEDLVNMVVPVYDRNFTTEEIDGLIVFYSSPVGQKVLAKLPVVMQESMQLGQAWGEELGKKVLLKLQQKGYIKEG
jgi:hypothetical protein